MFPKTVNSFLIPIAVWVIYGTKFWGTPIGNSPIKDEECAPIGLKYLNEIALKFEFEITKSLIISSPICLVLP